MGTALKREPDDDQPTNIKDLGDERLRGMPTRNTRVLMASKKSGNPVRLFRSAYQASIVGHRPNNAVGQYRYDGLYKVTSYARAKVNRAIVRFHMKRLPGQNPIRDF